MAENPGHSRPIIIMSNEEEFKGLMWWFAETETQATTPKRVETPGKGEQKDKINQEEFPPKKENKEALEKQRKNQKESGSQHKHETNLVTRKNWEWAKQEEQQRENGEKESILEKRNASQVVGREQPKPEETKNEIIVPRSSFDENYYSRVRKVRERLWKKMGKHPSDSSQEIKGKSSAGKVGSLQISGKSSLINPFVFSGESLMVPSPNIYEMTSEDLFFLKRFEKSSVKIKEYEDAVVIWENACGGQMTGVSLESGIELIKNSKLDSLIANQEAIEGMFLHWKTTREKLKRSLLRKFWKNNPQKQTKNPNFAFRPRKEQKMKLRKKNNEQENIERVISPHYQLLIGLPL